MSHRKVVGLKWARLGEGPELPIRRPRGAKALGLRYERALARALPGAIHGQWWEYEDLNGHGWCQTDLILRVGSNIVVLEAKYSWVEKGHEQMEELYFPVVEEALGTWPLGVQVCKNLRQGARHVSSTLEQSIDQARVGRSVLHWLGVGPLSSKPLPIPLSRSDQLMPRFA
jgi:hypothetical protein